jgi:hypothetical protein
MVHKEVQPRFPRTNLDGLPDGAQRGATHALGSQIAEKVGPGSQKSTPGIRQTQRGLFKNVQTIYCPQ